VPHLTVFEFWEIVYGIIVLTIRATLLVSFSKKEKCKNYNAVGNLVGKVPIYYYLGNKNCRLQIR
jgi:hypothetical protein